jgi:hypothetical protein
MLSETFDADDFPIASKPLDAPLASVFGISGQFDFTEYSTPPIATTAYQLVINNSDLSESFSISLFGDGNVGVQVGDPASIPLYLGTWTPVAGAAHVVHFSVDGAGVPTLFIDGVAIPLVFIADVPSIWASYPVNSVSYGSSSADATPASSPLRSLFVTAGVVGPGTVFCCP